MSKFTVSGITTKKQTGGNLEADRKMYAKRADSARAANKAKAKADQKKYKKRSDSLTNVYKKRHDSLVKVYKKNPVKLPKEYNIPERQTGGNLNAGATKSVAGSTASAMSAINKKAKAKKAKMAADSTKRAKDRTKSKSANRMHMYMKPTSSADSGMMKKGGDIRKAQQGIKTKSMITSPAAPTVRTQNRLAVTQPAYKPVYKPTQNGVNPTKPMKHAAMTAATDPRNSHNTNDQYANTNLSIGGGAKPVQYNTDDASGNGVYPMKRSTQINGVPSYNVAGGGVAVQGKSVLANMAKRMFRANPHMTGGVVLNGQKFNYSKY